MRDAVVSRGKVPVADTINPLTPRATGGEGGKSGLFHLSPMGISARSLLILSLKLPYRGS